ncbi:hypothetical protein [Ferrovibrio sp.]|uniref:hypothetical protein n=1 Tax=Ferrovibrio sp. TaxID=1917215 RepID=UPI0025BA85BE|nr:hypothetical protein [Ferrovibrio sp.]MBX3454827.1 hypothetical protein [Ferrovibrio sp.]
MQPAVFRRDPFWNTRVESFFVQALMPPESAAALDAVRDEIEAIAPGAFLRAPTHRLHVSVHVFASPREDFDKQAFWAAAEAPALAALDEYCAGAKAFAWHFQRLQAAELAVIALAAPDEHALGLRRLLSERVKRPAGLRPPYAEIHCTLLRYAAPEKLPADFAARIAALPCSVHAHIAALELLGGEVYPSLQTRTLKSYRLDQA